MRYAHSVTLLHQGCCVASGPPAEVLTSQRIEQVYGVRARWIQADTHRLLAVDGPLSSN
jgi:ABC-type cobalamin/Fe3+-siderophores transport system ATPase subunit